VPNGPLQWTAKLVTLAACSLRSQAASPPSSSSIELQVRPFKKTDPQVLNASDQRCTNINRSPASNANHFPAALTGRARYLVRVARSSGVNGALPQRPGFSVRPSPSDRGFNQRGTTRVFQHWVSFRFRRLLRSFIESGPGSSNRVLSAPKSLTAHSAYFTGINEVFQSQL